eukprot:scaffold982_cov139-Cylindrotheca_fusiformis.AAC.24
MSLASQHQRLRVLGRLVSTTCTKRGERLKPCFLRREAASFTQRSRCLSQIASRPIADIESGMTLRNDGDEMTLQSVITDIDTAARFNQGKGGGPRSSKTLWNPEFVKNTVEQYEDCLRFLYEQHQGISSKQEVMMPVELTTASKDMQKLFLSSKTTERAFRAMLRCKYPTTLLSQKVREWERYIGGIGQTSLTDGLSLRMLEANGKAGNVGRAITLLRIRKSRGYPPTRTEFVYAIQAIQSAGLYLRRNRNVYLSDNDQPQLDDPTRWLDDILLNMNQRGFPLTTELANRMLNTYASTGKSGKASHFFYRVLRHPVNVDESDGADSITDDATLRNMARFRNRPVQIRMAMRPPPPYHKIPSQVRGKLVRKPGTDIKQLKLDRELDPDWSPPLSAAVSFADSLTQGACGHDPIELDLISYSILIKACVNRGSLWRAMHILDEVMPANGVDPDVVAYNSLLNGLARVGDTPTMNEYFTKMLANNLSPTKETVKAIVDGLLNLGDVGSAITVVQDCFNQHNTLPPYTTHLKILEFALGRGLTYEAKRHVYFIQQLWMWDRNDYHSDEFARLMDLTQRNPKLSKEALQQLFAYFGEKLEDSDFISTR